MTSNASNRPAPPYVRAVRVVGPAGAAVPNVTGSRVLGHAGLPLRPGASVGDPAQRPAIRC